MGLSYWALSTKKKKKILFKWREIIPSRMCKDKLEKCDLFDCDSSLQHLTDMNQMTFPWEHMLKTNWSLEIFKDSSYSQQDHLHLVLICFCCFFLSLSTTVKKYFSLIMTSLIWSEKSTLQMMHWARGWVTKEGGGLQLSALMVDLTPLCQKRNIQGHRVCVRTLEQTSKLPREKVHELTIRQVAHREDLPGNLFSLLWNVLHPPYGQWRS